MDPSSHSAIETWADGFVGEGRLDYLDFASSRLSLPDWCSLARAFRPRFVEVSGCILWDRVYKPDNFRRWFSEVNGNLTAIESVLNRLRLWQFIDVESEEDDVAIRSLAGDVEFFWRASLREAFPDKKFAVSIIDTEDGPEVAFVLLRNDKQGAQKGTQWSPASG